MRRGRKLLVVVTAALLVGQFFAPGAEAAQITPRTLTLSSSSAASSNATTTYTFNFTVPTTGTAIKSLAVDICTTASGTCTTPTGFSNSSSTLSSQPINLGAASGWTVNTATSGSLRIVDAANATNPSGAQTVVFGNVQNPTTANQSFYGRITTYSDSAWATPVDTGVTAASTATQIVLTGTMPESLVFCVGGTVTGTDCSTATSGAVTFSPSLFSSTGTSSATSQMVASTNAGSGYSITVNGNTLQSGANSITAMGASTTSVVGTKQFGLNLVANTTPSVGAAVNPAPNGTNLKGQANSTTGYGTANNFKFVTGDSVAKSDNGGTANPTDAQNFTVSYIANVSGSQPAGTYTTTLTYICTATF